MVQITMWSNLDKHLSTLSLKSINVMNSIHKCYLIYNVDSLIS